MSRAVKITTFGSQTLSDATNYKQSEVRDSGPTARNSLYEDINGAYFDAAGSGTNTLVPGTVEVDLMLVETSAAAFVTKSNALLALRGTRATLTGTDASGNTITCTARCVSVPAVTRVGSLRGFNTSFTIVFRQVTNWA